MIRLFLVIVFLALPAAAETARVRSGEHDGFSRLVVTLDSPVDWVFGRVADGYQLRLDRGGVTFDLDQVFARIPKTRIGAVSAITGQSALSVTASCQCHAVPFEFRPGIIVIDLKDGPPPAGSTFETVLASPEPVPQLSAQVLRVDLAPVQDQLIREMGAAAAAGAIELALDPGRRPTPAPSLPMPQLRIMPEPGVAAYAGGGDPRPPEPQQSCIADDALALRDWASDDRGALSIGPARGGLAGEFDDLDPARVEALLRHYLALGFGAEARQLAAVLPPGHPMQSTYQSLSYIVDGEPDLVQAFAGMETCDTAASLWAVLARAALRPSEKINAAALVRSFSALPAGLRSALNDRLGQRLLEQGDAESARRIRDSVARLGPSGEAAGRLLDARLEGPGADPAPQLEAIIADHGPDEAAALIARIRLAAERAEPLPPKTVPDLETLIQMGHDADQGLALREALVFARALTGDFSGAFDAIPNSPNAAPMLWSLLAQIGPDTDVMQRAILAETAKFPSVSLETAITISSRLLDLGFVMDAQRWFTAALPVGPVDATDRLLAGRIALGQGDARAVMQVLAADTTPEALTIKADAALALGNAGLAADMLGDAGAPERAREVTNLTRNWAEVQNTSDTAWATAAKVAAMPPQPTPPSLGASRGLLADTAALQMALAELLATP